MKMLTRNDSALEAKMRWRSFKDKESQNSGSAYMIKDIEDGGSWLMNYCNNGATLSGQLLEKPHYIRTVDTIQATMIRKLEQTILI